MTWFTMMLVGLTTVGAAIAVVGVTGATLRWLLGLARQRRAIRMLKRWRTQRRFRRQAPK